MFGSDAPDVAAAFNSLAVLYRASGDYAKTEPLHRRALAIWEKALGQDHPDVANSLSDMAVLYQAMGDYAKAEPLHRQALEIREKALGLEHPDVAMSLGHLASLEAAQHHYHTAVNLNKKALAGRPEATHSFATPPQKLAFLDSISGDYYGFLSLIRQHFMGDQAVLREGLESV
jgi:tetratricopeptide (TPR) repeat protein